ncbi:MAG: hypothetical protein ACI8ZF_000256 [Candidatus Midichloriaceae bacterium]|jgi:hypothetical protein
MKWIIKVIKFALVLIDFYYIEKESVDQNNKELKNIWNKDISLSDQPEYSYMLYDYYKKWGDIFIDKSDEEWVEFIENIVTVQFILMLVLCIPNETDYEEDAISDAEKLHKWNQVVFKKENYLKIKEELKSFSFIIKSYMDEEKNETVKGGLETIQTLVEKIANKYKEYQKYSKEVAHSQKQLSIEYDQQIHKVIKYENKDKNLKQKFYEYKFMKDILPNSKKTKYLDDFSEIIEKKDFSEIFENQKLLEIIEKRDFFSDEMKRIKSELEDLKYNNSYEIICKIIEGYQTLFLYEDMENFRKNKEKLIKHYLFIKQSPIIESRINELNDIIGDITLIEEDLENIEVSAGYFHTISSYIKTFNTKINYNNSKTKYKDISYEYVIEDNDMVEIKDEEDDEVIKKDRECKKDDIRKKYEEDDDYDYEERGGGNNTWKRGYNNEVKINNKQESEDDFDSCDNSDDEYCDSSEIIDTKKIEQARYHEYELKTVMAIFNSTVFYSRENNTENNELFYAGLGSLDYGYVIYPNISNAENQEDIKADCNF